MTLWWVNGQVVDDQQEGASIPEYGELVNPWTGAVTSWGDKSVQPLPTYSNRYQYGGEQASFQWDPQAPWYRPAGGEGNIGYGPSLISLADRVASGQATDLEREEYGGMRAAALAVPMRDPATLRGDYRFAGDSAAPAGILDLRSPDLGALLLTLRDKRLSGTATPQEQTLYENFLAHAQWQDWQATVPQPSDAFSPLGDNLMGALGILALGASGGLAAAPLAAGGAGLATTLGSLGTLSGIAGTGASVLGQAMDQPWLSKLGMGLGAAGGIAGGLGGLANLWGTGIHSLGDVGRLASHAGRITGGIGTLADSDVLRQAGGYLGAAGQLGSGVQTIADVFGGGVQNLTDAARLVGGVGQVGSAVGRVTGNRPLQQAAGLLGMGSRLGSGVQGLLGAAGQAQQRGMQPQGAPVPRTMADNEWLGQHWQPGPWQQPQPVLWNL